jgi:hypothetical protein
VSNCSHRKVAALPIEEYFIPLSIWSRIVCSSRLVRLLLILFETRDFKAFFNAADEYSIDHKQMSLYKGSLRPGDIVVVDCHLEQFPEKSSGLEKVGFSFFFLVEPSLAFTGLGA